MRKKQQENEILFNVQTDRDIALRLRFNKCKPISELAEQSLLKIINCRWFEKICISGCIRLKKWSMENIDWNLIHVTEIVLNLIDSLKRKREIKLRSSFYLKIPLIFLINKCSFFRKSFVYCMSCIENCQESIRWTLTIVKLKNSEMSKYSVSFSFSLHRVGKWRVFLMIEFDCSNFYTTVAID